MAKASNQGPLSGLTPHITVDGARKAIDFYKKAFAAKERTVMPAQDGKRIMHAHLEINGASLMLNDDFPEFHGGKPGPKPGAVTLHLQVGNADKWWERAVKAGAKIAMPMADQFWGDRYGQLTDPFGHTWSIGAPSKKSAKVPAMAEMAAAAPPKAAKKAPAKAPPKKAAKAKRG